jgi:DNA-directed RNA polymerase specialized sigma24 family protein
MQIVNPLYDKAFKYLMENERLAKKVISVILDEEIDELHLSQQETVVPDTKHQLTLFRLDFKAIIRKPDGTRHKVLIELQKSKFDTDIKRFRAYLGSNYLKTEIEKSLSGEEIKSSYPIITIYILGYPIEDIPYLAVTVNPNVINSINKEPVQIKSDFIQQLSHRSHILQVRRLPEERKSRLEKFMVLFNQAWCTEHKYIIDLHDVPKEFEEIARHLQKPVLDEEFRRQLEGEEELDEIFDKQESKYLKQIEEAKHREEEAIKREKNAIERQVEAQNKLKSIVLKQYQKGKSIKEIADDLGLEVEEIKKITGKG